MFQMRRAVFCCVGLVGLGLTVWAWNGSTQKTDPRTLHPKKSVVYLAWDGGNEHEAAIKETAQYKALVESGLFDYGLRLIDQSMGTIMSQLGPGGPQGDLEQAFLLKSTFQSIYENGFSLSITDGEGDFPAPVGTIVLHNGADAIKLVPDLIEELNLRGEIREKALSGRDIRFVESPNNPGVEIAWWVETGHLVVTVGVAASERVAELAEGKAANVTASRLWKKCRPDDADFAVAAVGWLDIETLRNRFGGMPVPVDRNQEPVSVIELATKLGLDNLNAVGGRFGYRGEATVSHTFVDAPGPRKGVLAMMDQESFTINELPPLPADCVAFGAFSMNAAAAWDTTLQTVQSVTSLMPPDAKEELNEALEVLPQHLGLDVRKDLLAALGNVHCFYSDPAGGPLGMGFGMAFSVKDRDKLTDAVDTLAERSQQLLQQAPTPVPLAIQRVSMDDREFLTLPAGMFTPTLAIGDDWLVVTLYPQSARTFFMREDGKLPKWEPSAAHKKALAELPKSFTSVSVEDPRQGLRALYGFVPMFNSAIHSFAPGFGPEAVKAAELPPQEVVVAPLFPNVSVSVVGDDGVSYHSRRSLPLAPIPAAESGVAVPVLVALLLPAVQQARIAARRTQSKNNMRQLGLAMHNYHDVWSHFPIGTQQDTDLKPDKRLSFLYAVLPYLEEAPLYDALRDNEKKAWDDEEIRELTSTTLSYLLNPEMAANSEGETHYVGMAGIGEDAPELKLPHERAGIFGYDRKTSFRDITDGSSNTIMMTETNETKIPWAAGGKTLKSLTQEPYINGPDGIGGPYPGGCHVLMADGSVRFISENIDAETMRRLSAMADGKVIRGF